MIIEYNKTKPRIATSVFVAPNATIIGDVEIGENSSIWYGAVLRGDMAPIKIGANTSIQDNCTVHTDYGKPTNIGSYVTVGHNAVVHGCTIEDFCLIGMASCVLNAACVKTGSIIAAGSVVKENQIVGPYQMVTGVPSVLKKTMNQDIIEILKLPAQVYVELAENHKNIKT